ncbi:fluoride efflux transporter CrcB [Skermania sp. ID1734]|uniref:fluoride efflux transporter CrcB n=1 Tax=Skermania sp. ID1734 TaxID=2597516 RepID=UPI00117C3EFC|nr:fluoride efflux transporter CrcB [Skermania sp. ID1734]TSD99343.1 fluoride efflux transporter CrcB [Skermania sp. ID1734]
MITTALVWLGVVIAGGVGAVARFLVDRAVTGYFARPFPYGTFVVNISGAVILGFVSGLSLGHNAALIAGTAAVGSYTTFSTWMLESHRLAEERQLGLSAANIVCSVILGVAAALLGQTLATML